MKVLVVGGGGREHALVWKLAQSPVVRKIYAAPGNAGMFRKAESVNIAPDRVKELAEYASRQKIDLTVVGPEVPLTLGIVDEFQKRRLRLGWRTVDFVCQDDVVENRSGHEDKLPLPGGRIFLNDVGSGNVRRHEVGGELNSGEVQIEHLGYRVHDEGFRQPWHTGDDAVASDKQR